MCLLTYFPAGQKPDCDRLENGADANPDGHGWAIVCGDRIMTGHGLIGSYAVEQFSEARAEWPDGPALFHSRIATDGARTKDNCHPFLMGGDDERTVLAHNGILADEARPSNADKRSDTRILAEDLLPNDYPGKPYTRRGRKRIAHWLGHANKVVILTVDPAYTKNAYVLNEHMGMWRDGVWYSNDSFDETTWWHRYMSRYDRSGSKYWPDTSGEVTWVKDAQGVYRPVKDVAEAEGEPWTDADYDPTPDGCELCGALHSVSAISGMCAMCLTCNMCLMGIDMCLCFRGGRGSVTDQARYDKAALDIVLGKPAD